MKMKLSIKSKQGQECTSKVESDGKTYIVETDDQGRKSARIITNTYLDGAITDSLTTDYSDIVNEPDSAERIRAMVASQHKSVVEALTKKTALKTKPVIEYVKEMNGLLKKGKQRAALETVKQAVGDYPSDPFFVSYLGYLTGQVERQYRKGCDVCESAVALMMKAVSEDKDFFYPILYLNLGRAYVLAGKKPDAIKAFQDGLRYDRKNKNIISELAALGIRKPPVVSFLDRKNPINKYLGKIRHKLGN